MFFDFFIIGEGSFMDKKIRIYIFITISCSLFGIVFSMEQHDLTLSNFVFNVSQQLFIKEIVSAVAVNDYIIPVTTFSQALKKEALLTYACLEKMKYMAHGKINALNNRHRAIMQKECTHVYTADLSDIRKQTFHISRDFSSKRMDITYSRSLNRSDTSGAYMKKYIYIHPVSPLGLKADQLPTNDIVVHNLGFALRNELEKVLKEGESFAIELYSQGNVSDWFKVINSFGPVKPVKTISLPLKNTLSAEECSLFHERDLDYNPLDIQGIKIAGYSLFTGAVLVAAILVNGLLRSA